MAPLASTSTAPLTAVNDGKPACDALNIGVACLELPAVVSAASSALPGVPPAVPPVPVPEAPLAGAAIIAMLPGTPCFADTGGQALAADVMAADRVGTGAAEPGCAPAAAGLASDETP
jgi:hypothetical protein